MRRVKIYGSAWPTEATEATGVKAAGDVKAAPAAVKRPREICRDSCCQDL